MSPMAGDPVLVFFIFTIKLISFFILFVSSCSGENESQSPERWMLQLFAELEKEEIILPERYSCCILFVT